MSQDADFIVIGAGVLGSFHAYFAAKKGVRTLLMERNAFPNDASTRNFGLLAPSSIVDPTGEWGAFARDSVEIYRSIQAQCDISVAVTGSLYLASSAPERAVLHEFAGLFSGAHRCVFLEPEEVARRYHFVRDSYCTGALLFPDDLTVEPRRMLRRLIGHMLDEGRVTYVPGTTAVSIESGSHGCRVVAADGNIYAADCVVICNGAEYRTLFPELFTRSEIQVCKLHMARIEPVRDFRLPHAVLSGLSIRRYPAFRACPSFELLERQPVEEAIDSAGIHLLFTQSADGSIVVGDSHEYRPCGEAATLEERSNPAIAEAIFAYARTMLDLPSWRVQEFWNGYYLTHTERPVYEVRVDARVHVITAIGGKGMTTGPGYARRSVEALFG